MHTRLFGGTISTSTDPICVGETLTFNIDPVSDTGGEFTSTCDTGAMTPVGSNPRNLRPRCCDPSNPCCAALLTGFATSAASGQCCNCGAGEMCCNKACAAVTCTLALPAGTGCPGGIVSLDLTGACRPACWTMGVNVVAQPPNATVTVVGGPFTCGSRPAIRTVNVLIDANAPPGPINFDLVTNTGPLGVSCQVSGLVNVIKVDLGFAGLADNDETNPGGFLCVDDLLPMTLSVTPAQTTGTAELKLTPWTLAGGQIRVYKNANRTQPIFLTSGTETWPIADMPPVLYVEGLQPSTAARNESLLLTYTDNNGHSCSDQVRLTVMKIEIDSIDFTGGVDIRVDELVDLPNPEWLRTTREAPNTSAPYTSGQSAPAAYVKGNPLQCVVKISTTPALDATVSLWGDATAPAVYGDFAQLDIAVAAATGTGQATFQSANTITSVSVDTVAYAWKATQIVVGPVTNPLGCEATTSEHRIYTLQAVPTGAKAEPWLPLLELGCGLADGLNTDTPIVETITRGIHWSEWQALNDARFINPTGTVLIYDPLLPRTAVLGPSTDPFTHQRYDLSNFLGFFLAPTVVQQCNDNSNFEAVLLQGIGVASSPLFLAGDPPFYTSGPFLLPTAPYFGAGDFGPGSALTIAFKFHQFVVRNGVVYDPSIRSTDPGDPFMGMSLNDYLNAAFPGQVSAGFKTSSVTTLEIGNVTFAAFTATGVTPGTAKVGISTPVSITGAGFFNPVSPITLTLVEVGMTAPISDGSIVRDSTPSSTLLNATVTINTGATPRAIEILVRRNGEDRPLSFSIIP